MDEITRDEAIRFIYGTVTRNTVAEGAELVDLIGPQAAATLTLQQLAIVDRAFAALGVTEEDVARVARQIEAQREAAGAF